MNDTNTLHTPSPITTPLPHCLPTRCRLSPHHPHLSITTRLTMIIRGGGAWGSRAPHLSRTLTRIECAKKMKEYSWKNHAV